MTAIDRLIELGKRRGGLEIGDIRQALPVDTMPTAELAEVLAHLEEAGISIEIDPALLTGRHGKMILGRAKSATEPPQHSEPVIVDHGHLAVLRSSIKAAARESSSRTSRAPLPYSQKSATVFVLAAALILLLIALSVWCFA
jgi:hypothetical protein